MQHVRRRPTDSLHTGASGTGRTTFVNTLIEQPLIAHRSHQILTNPEDPHSPINPSALREHAQSAGQEQPIQIKSHHVELEEDGVRISLTVVDTPGFGDGIDNEYSYVFFSFLHG